MRGCPGRELRTQARRYGRHISHRVSRAAVSVIKPPRPLQLLLLSLISLLRTTAITEAMATSSKACTTVSRRLQSLPWTPALGLLLLALASQVVLEATAAPASSSSSAAALADYDTVRELYEMLVRRAAMEEAAAARGPPLASLLADAGALQDHELVRKSTANRSPSLRLRFGRRADPMLAPSFHAASSAETAANN